MRARRRRVRLVVFAAIALFTAFSWHVSGVDLGVLFGARALGQLGHGIASMFPPRVDAAFIGSLARPVLETIAIAFVGISGALLIALPLTFFAVPPYVLRSEEDAPRSAIARAIEAKVHLGARAILGVLRTVPEMIWALMFVRAIGLGMVPGVLAIAFSYAGVLGKVFAEIIEGVNKGPLEALRASGAGRLKVFLFAVVPQSFPLILSYTLYRFDCALRSSAVLGLVGAGGVGFQIELSIKMMEYGEVLTEILVLFGLVALSDLLSAQIRARFAKPDGRRAGGWIWAGGYFGLLVLGLVYTGTGPSTLGEALGGVGSFFVRAYPPESSGTAMARYLKAGAETVGISFLGTAIALLIALPLAVAGAKRAFGAGDEHLASKSRRLERALGFAASACARFTLNILRTIPMVIFALIFVPAIGIGPFAGVLAIACHTAGAFGRLYMEVIEEVNPRTLEAFRGFGAKKTQILAFAVMPQTLSQLLSFFFYRWEVNLRESVILGIVGGGGIGQLIYMTISLFQEHETYSLIIALLILVGLADAGSALLRRFTLERKGVRTDARAIGAEALLSA